MQKYLIMHEKHKLEYNTIQRNVWQHNQEKTSAIHSVKHCNGCRNITMQANFLKN